MFGYGSPYSYVAVVTSSLASYNAYLRAQHDAGVIDHYRQVSTPYDSKGVRFHEAVARMPFDPALYDDVKSRLRKKP